ncbi:MAG: phytoene/squalene synthase family protein [Halobacteriaceae archaeon]
MVTRTQLQTSKAIQRQTGHTFHVATRFLPERARHPTYVLYAFFRLADEVVDDPDPAPPDQLRQELRELRAAALGQTQTTEPVLNAVDDLRRRHQIPATEIDEFIDAMHADVEHTGYATHEDLATYLRGSSVAVANMMLSVMEPADPAAARPHAAALAEAFQLTNFLRDVAEDITDYDRVYLPEATLAEHGVTRDQLRHREVSPGFRTAIRTELNRTETRYREGVAGIKYLPDDCQFPVVLAAVLYAEHHRLIRAADGDVLTTRPSLGRLDYLRVLARTAWHWHRSHDPETTFYNASAVTHRPDDRVGDLESPGLPASIRSMVGRARTRWPLGSGE